MADANLMEQIGATPRKLALVGVLAIVLVTVIVVQLPEQPAPAELAQRRPAAAQQVRKRKPVRQRTLTQSKNQKVDKQETTPAPTQGLAGPMEWPELALADQLKNDWFAAPGWFVAAKRLDESPEEKGRLAAEQEKERRQKELLQQLLEEGAKAVVISGKEKLAAIGEHPVRIGDSFYGFRITDITKSGVVVTELDETPSTTPPRKRN